MRGFQKGITLGGRASGSVWKVSGGGGGGGGGGVGWSSDNTVSKVQRILDLDQDLGSFLDSDFGF